MSEAAAARELERTGWDARVATYGLLTGRITAQVVEPLLDAAAVAPGMRVLDVGTGPGYAAAEAKARGAAVTAVDIAKEVLALARERHRGVRFVYADAEDLPFADRSFDAVVGNFAISHLPRPELAAAEFARVLSRGGRIALSTWDVPARSRFLGILVDALAEAGVAGPDRFRFADDGEFRALLRGAGFRDVDVEPVAVTQRVADPDELWRGVLGGSVRTAALLEQQPPEVRAQVRSAVLRLAEEHRDGDALAVPAHARIASGSKP